MKFSQFSSVAQLCLTLWDPMACSTPGFPVHHQLLELAQTHVHWVSDAIQPSHPLSSPSPPAFRLSLHQGLFHWVRSSHQVATYWSLSVSISPSSEYSGLISFRMDWVDLLEKAMVTHSSVLAWRIPGTGEPGGLLSMGSHRVGHDWSDLAAVAAAEYLRD